MSKRSDRLAAKLAEARDPFNKALDAWLFSSNVLDRESHARRLARFADKLDEIQATTAERTQVRVATEWLVFAKDEIYAAQLHETLRVKLPADLTDIVTRSKASLARFAEKLAEDPCSALEWSRGEFEVAARMSVCQTVLSWLTMDRATEMADAELRDLIVSETRAQLRRRARSLEQSTSPTSNLMADNLRCAWARMDEVMENLVPHGVAYLGFSF